MSALRLEWRSPAELSENPANWRRHPQAQIEALSDVISEVGWAGACLFNERTGRLIDGHARKAVGLANGAASIPVLVGSWSEEDERKILATLDPLAAMAEADKGALESLLADVNTQSSAINAMLEELAKDGSGGIEAIGLPELPAGDKEPFQQMTFTLHDSQAALVCAAIDLAKKVGPFSGPNENSNGNALTRICEAYRG